VSTQCQTPYTTFCVFCVVLCLFLYGPFCHGALILTCLHCLQPFSYFQCIILVRQSIHFRHSNIIHYLYNPSNTPCRTSINIHKLTKKPAKHVTQQWAHWNNFYVNTFLERVPKECCCFVFLFDFVEFIGKTYILMT